MADPAAAVEAYLAGYPQPRQGVLRDVRRVLHEAVPGSGDRLSYGIPTIVHDAHGLVHYAGWKDHLAVYPVPAGDADLAAALVPFRGGKGTLRFAWEDVPLELVARVGAALLAERG